MKSNRLALNAPVVIALATSADTARFVRLVFGLLRLRRVVVVRENLPFFARLGMFLWVADVGY